MKNKSNKKIGESGCIVEIDESLFTKRTNNSGGLLPQQSVFGGICKQRIRLFSPFLIQLALPLIK